MDSPNYVSIVGFREYFVLLTAENNVPMPSPFIKYIQNEQHYTEVISRVATVKQSLWMGAWCKKCGRKDVCIDKIG